MSDDKPYNALVRACFEKPDRAGDLQGDYALVVTSEVAASGHGARVVLSAGITDGMITDMRFRAWGCPHFIAAAQTLCVDREHGPVAGLAALDTNGLMDKLSIPQEKTGKMLLLDDALQLLWEQYENAA